MESPALVAPPYVAAPLRLDPFRAIMLAPYRIGDPRSARAFARPYRDVATRLARLEVKGLVRRDPEPALYVHEYRHGGAAVRGLVGVLDLSRRATSNSDAAVMPHEGVHPPQVAELSERMLGMALNPAPILLVYRGPAEARRLLRELTDRVPDRQFTDHGGQEHHLWALRDPATHVALAAAIADSRTVIADGHHRYAAYLKLQTEHRGTGWDGGLAMLIDQDDTPLRLGPIHRLLRRGTWQDLHRALEGTPHRLGPPMEHDPVGEPRESNTVLVTDGRRQSALRLLLDEDTSAVQAFDRDVIAHWRRRTKVTHHHSTQDLLAVRRDAGGLAFVFPAVDFDVVSRTVAAERLLPEKATSFQPKPHLGVLMRSTRD